MNNNKKAAAPKYTTRFFLWVGLVLVIGLTLVGGASLDRFYGFSFLDRLLPRIEPLSRTIVSQRVLNEESRVIEVVEKVGPSVVTVSISKKEIISPFSFDFGPFGFFGPSIGREEQIEQDIGSGFVISKDGLIVTNRHVVEDRDASYKNRSVIFPWDSAQCLISCGSHKAAFARIPPCNTGPRLPL